MRTKEELINRIKEREKEDFLGFEWPYYLYRLDYESAKPWLKEDTKKEDWTPKMKDPIEEIKDYMEFAWEKANNCRGISASRNISHIIAWLWLADHPIWQEVEDKFENEYQHYGKDILQFVCEELGIDYHIYDDGYRVNSESERWPD